MHAYLIIGRNKEEVKTKVNGLVMKLNFKPMEFPLAKIEDTRALNSFLKLQVTAPTAIIINSIEGATPEATNAFLKNLEEPQKDVVFILTSESIYKVLPTITSRCQIIKVKDEKVKGKSGEAEKFLEMSVGEKLAYTDQIRDRGEAKIFVLDLIETLHQLLHENGDGFSQTAENIEVAQKTLLALEANGNVTLQLTNLVVNLK